MKKLTIERKFNAPIEKIWEAFSKPEILKEWWSPEGMHCSFVTVDFKPSGLFHFCFKGNDGNEFWGRGIYQTIQQPSLITYLDSFADKDGNAVPASKYGMQGDEIQETLVEFSFTQKGKTAILSMVGDNPFDDNMTAEMTKGWNGMFDKLAKVVDK